MFISEGVTVDRHFLFLLKDIGGTEGGVGERRADRRARDRGGTKRRLLTRGGRCLYDLCLDDTQNLPDLTTNRGDYHGDLVEEITSITRASQVREPRIRFSQVTIRSVGTRGGLGDVEVLEVEVGAAFRAVRR